MKKWLFFLFCAISPSSYGDPVRDLLELSRLPEFCRGTQQIIEVSKDARPHGDWVRIYGDTYRHFHHYCWALNSENNAILLSESNARKSKLEYALGDIKYVLDRTTPDFYFLPEVYNGQARILFKLKRDPEGVSSLNKAIEIKPDFVPAYLQLADYYVRSNDKKNAAAVLRRGIDNIEKSKVLIKRLEQLGEKYEGVPGHLRKKDEKPASDDVASDKKTNNDSKPVESAIPPENSKSIEPSKPAEPPADERPANNPYCRFCP